MGLWDGGFVDLWDSGVCGMEMNKKKGGGDVRVSKSPSEMAYRGQLLPLQWIQRLTENV